jgi:hypothetical protein
VRASLAFVVPILVAGVAHAQDTTETPPPPPPPPTTTATVTAPPPPPPVAPAETIVTDSHARLRVDTKIGSGLLGWVGLVPQLVVGGNFGRWSVGLGVGFVRGSLDASSVGNPSGTQLSVTYLSFAPTVQLDLIRSTDNRVALYALAALAPSLVVVDGGGGGGGPCNGGAGFVLGYQTAIGARYAFHKQFMLGVERGPSGVVSTMVGCSTPGSTNIAPALHAMYGALVGTFLTP